MNIKCILAVTAISLSGIVSASDEKTDPFPVIYEKGSVHVLRHYDYGTNIGVLIFDNGILLIDPMAGKENLPALSKELNKYYRPDNPVCLVNTHGHIDHAGGNAFFVKSGAVVYTVIQPKPICQTLLSHVELYREHSHSLNDLIIFIPKENLIFVGDIFDSSWHPTFYAGGLKGFDAAIDRILSLGDDQTVIIPGHGLPASKTDLVAFRENTHHWVRLIKQLLQQNLSIEDIMANTRVISQVNKFNVQNRQPFIPEKSLRRFIERTQALIEND